MKQYEVSKPLKSVITYVNQNKNVQKRKLVNHLCENGFFEKSFELCSKFVEWLKIQKFIKVCNPFYGYLKLTEKALEWSKESKEVYVSDYFLENIKENYQLLMGLKLIRKTIADEKGMELFKVCPNYMLEKLAYYQPDNLDNLFKIRGFKEWKGDTQWHRYVEVIKEWRIRQDSDYQLSA